MGQRILLIEDDAALGTQIVGHLRAAGFETRWLTSGASFHRSEDCDFDLLLLDLMLPGVPGLESSSGSASARTCRSSSSARATTARRASAGCSSARTTTWPNPSGPRSSWSGCARGCGGRRSSAPPRSRSAPCASILHTREVTVDGESVALTGTEYAILAALARRRGAPVTRQSLGELLDADNENPDRTVDVHVSRLRKKLGEAGPSIVTVWGIGYRLGGGPTP